MVPEENHLIQGAGGTMTEPPDPRSPRPGPAGLAKGNAGPGRGKRGAEMEPRLDAPPTLAEARIGELIKEQKETVGLNEGRLKQGAVVPERNHGEPPTLAEAGIGKKLSAKAQMRVAIPE